jgi:uncharacterized protein YbaP (TraB family)
MVRFAVALLLALTSCARTCPPPRAFPAGGRPFLWEARGPAGQLVWLYGTIHVGGAEDVPKEAWAALDGSKVFVSELGDVPSEELEKHVFLPRGKGLDQLLPAESWYDLRDTLVPRGVKEELLKRVRPWYAMSLLVGRVYDAPDPGMDLAMRQRAGARGLELRELESAARQLSALDESVGVDDLAQAIADRKHMACALRDLMAGYRAGDDATLTGQLGAEDEARLVGARNAEWLPHIEALDRAFVAVGASHLIGDGGIPAMLAARGWTVRRL